MKNNLTPDPDANMVNAMGKRKPDRAHFGSVINLYDEEVRKSDDRAGAYARRAIAICMGIHGGDLDASDIEKCRSDINEALLISKDLTIVQIAQGCYHYYCMNDFNKAIASFENASELDPYGYKPLFYMAMVYKAMGKWEELRSLLDMLVKLKIRNPLSLTNIGLCFDYLHDFDKALEYHQKAIDANNEWSAAYMNKFYTLLLKGNTSEARIVLESLIKITNEDHVEYQIILDLYDGRYNEAFTTASKAKPEDFSDPGEKYLNQGKISLLLDDKMNADKYFDKALDELNQELVAHPGNAETHFLTGMVHAWKGDKTHALTEGKEAVRIAERYKNKILEIEMNINLAMIYTTLGMDNEAIEKIKDALAKPSLFSARILLLDPVWKPLWKNPGLKDVISKYENK